MLERAWLAAAAVWVTAEAAVEVEVEVWSAVEEERELCILRANWMEWRGRVIVEWQSHQSDVESSGRRVMQLNSLTMALASSGAEGEEEGELDDSAFDGERGCGTGSRDGLAAIENGEIFDESEELLAVLSRRAAGIR